MHSPYHQPHYINVLLNPYQGAFSLFPLLSLSLSLSHNLYLSFRSSPTSPFFGSHFLFSTFTIFSTILSPLISLLNIFIFTRIKHLYIAIQPVLFILDNVKFHVISRLFSGLVITCSYGCRAKVNHINIMYSLYLCLFYYILNLGSRLFFMYEFT